MFSRCLPLVMLAALLLPVRAHADPVTIPAHFVGGGAAASVRAALPSRAPTRLGATPRMRIDMPRANAAAQSSIAISVRGQVPRSDYMMELIVHGGDSAWTTMRAEVLGQPRGGGNNNGNGVQPFHSSVADAFSSSGNNGHGPSFQNSGLERSAVFAGGSASVTLNGNGNAAEILFSSGLAGAPAIRILLGLRDFDGGRGLLVRFAAVDSAVGGDNAVSSTPEPASMFLIGTGLAGLAAIRRRRSAGL